MATPTPETVTKMNTKEETINGDNNNDAPQNKNSDSNGNSNNKQENHKEQQQQNNTEKNGIITSSPTKQSTKESNTTTSEKRPQSQQKEDAKTKKKSSNLSKSSESNNTSPLPSLTDPNAIRFKFIFANHDGLNVHIDSKLTDTVGELKGALLSVWPKGLPDICESDRIRLICMGRGFLMPDTRNLKDCSVPVFKTHATPINVSIKPKSLHNSNSSSDNNKNSKYGGILSSNNNNSGNNNVSNGGAARGGNGNSTARQGCACVVS